MPTSRHLVVSLTVGFWERVDSQLSSSPRYDGVEVEEVGGQQPGCLGFEECAPLGVGSARRGPCSCRDQDAADGAGSDVVSESGEPALDAAMSPTRVLSCQPDDRLTDLSVDPRPARPARIGPFLGDQASVPGQEGGRCDEAMAAQLSGQDSGQGGQERPVGPGWAGWAELAAEHRDLVPKRQRLGDQGAPSAAEQREPRKYPGQGQVEQAYDHGMILAGPAGGRTCRSGLGIEVMARYTAGSGGLGGPVAGDESLVPAQDRRGHRKEPESPAGGEQAGQSGDQGSVGPADPRSGTAPLEYRELVAQDEELDLLGGVGPGAQHHPAQELGAHEVDQL